MGRSVWGRTILREPATATVAGMLGEIQRDYRQRALVDIDLPTAETNPPRPTWRRGRPILQVSSLRCRCVPPMGDTIVALRFVNKLKTRQDVYPGICTVGLTWRLPSRGEEHRDTLHLCYLRHTVRRRRRAACRIRPPRARAPCAQQQPARPRPQLPGRVNSQESRDILPLFFSVIYAIMRSRIPSSDRE